MADFGVGENMDLDAHLVVSLWEFSRKGLHDDLRTALLISLAARLRASMSLSLVASLRRDLE